MILLFFPPLVLAGLAASSEPLIFSADGAEEDDDEGVSSGDYGMDGSAPWYLRVQELAHDSLIAATRAQLARDAKASQDARTGSVTISNVTLSSSIQAGSQLSSFQGDIQSVAKYWDSGVKVVLYAAVHSSYLVHL